MPLLPKRPEEQRALDETAEDADRGSQLALWIPPEARANYDIIQRDAIPAQSWAGEEHDLDGLHLEAKPHLLIGGDVMRTADDIQIDRCRAVEGLILEGDG